MRLLGMAAMAVGVAMAQTPDVGTIMARVGENQERASEARREFTFHQKQLLRMNRGGGKLAREEKREYDVAPGAREVRRNWCISKESTNQKGNTFPTIGRGTRTKRWTSTAS
jgi:hypothetical protein